ncbi:Imidazolonepropionase [Trinorchestia longiramus]|nr:Imidazolonepropionase [Trinorchestia longiramus]
MSFHIFIHIQESIAHNHTQTVINVDHEENNGLQHAYENMAMKNEEYDGKTHEVNENSKVTDDFEVIQLANAEATKADTVSTKSDKEENKHPALSEEEAGGQLAAMFMLGTAYSANLGGVAFPTGTGPNLILWGFLESSFTEPTSINFATWMAFNVPVMLVCEVLAFLTLDAMFIGWGKWRKIPPTSKKKELAIRRVVLRSYRSLGRITFHETAVFFLFLTLVFLWVFRSPGFTTGWVDVMSNDVAIGNATPAILIVFLMFIVPANPKIWPFYNESLKKDHEEDEEPRACLTWDAVESGVPWGLIILMGGGFAMAEGALKSGLSLWLGQQLQYFAVLPHSAIVFLIVTFATFLTEVVSNMTTANIFLPVVRDLALGIGMNPLFLMLPTCIGCSYALMMPVSNPPNAIAFNACDSMTTQDMMKAGLIVKLLKRLYRVTCWMMAGRLLVHGAHEVVRVGAPGELYKKGPTMRDLHVLSAHPPAGLSVVVNRDGDIEAIGSDDEVKTKYGSWKFDHVLDARGCCVLPGLVDAHTHPVWGGDRVHEFTLKLSGASYLEVQEAGGGIHWTVARTKETSDDLLLELLLQRLQRMLVSDLQCAILLPRNRQETKQCCIVGTTLVEAKSGYGLDTSEELRLLKVLHRASSLSPLTIVPTFLGAHAIPPSLEAEEATRRVVEEQLPAVMAAKRRGELSVESVDVFCETGVYSVSETRRIAQAARQEGLMLNLHVDELSPLGGAKMAGELKAEAVSHCEEVSTEGVEALASGGTVAVLLPTTQLLLGLKAPPAREMIDKGVIVALGSDFNPNAHCLSMSTVLHLACVLLRMSPAEALTAATLNAAHSIRRSHRHGALQPGMVGDMVIIRAPRWEHLVYQLGEHASIIQQVVCAGQVIYSKPAGLP